MKNKNFFYLTLIVIIILLSVSCLFFIYKYIKADNMTSLFSWKKSIVYDENKDTLNRVIDDLKIGRMFQAFDENSFNTNDTHIFLDFLSNKNVKVYYLTGEPSWAVAEDGLTKMKEEIDIVYNWNRNVDKSNQLSGIVFDIEPYLLDNWKEDNTSILESYNKKMKEAYNYAHDKNVSVILCIPYWYDNDHIIFLDELIKNCCDEVAVMNYYKSKEYENIKIELAIAKKYNKNITTIFEFIMPGKHGLTDKNTYFNDGIQAAQEVYRSLYNNFKYKNFYCSYHHLEPITELLKK